MQSRWLDRPIEINTTAIFVYPLGSRYIRQRLDQHYIDILLIQGLQSFKTVLSCIHRPIQLYYVQCIQDLIPDRVEPTPMITFIINRWIEKEITIMGAEINCLVVVIKGIDLLRYIIIGLHRVGIQSTHLDKHARVFKNQQHQLLRWWLSDKYSYHSFVFQSHLCKYAQLLHN